MHSATSEVALSLPAKCVSNCPTDVSIAAFPRWNSAAMTANIMSSRLVSRTRQIDESCSFGVSPAVRPLA